MSTSYSRVIHPTSVDYKEEISNKDKKIKEEFHKNQAYRFRADDPIICSALAPNFEYLVAGCDNSIVLYGLAKKERIMTKEEAHKKNLSALAISNDSNFLVSGSASGELALWQLNSMQRIKYLPEAHEGAITSLKFTSTGSHVISVSLDGNISIWNVERDMSHEVLH
jgi:WD40 repeat protein